MALWYKERAHLFRLSRKSLNRWKSLIDRYWLSLHAAISAAYCNANAAIIWIVNWYWRTLHNPPVFLAADIDRPSPRDSVVKLINKIETNRLWWCGAFSLSWPYFLASISRNFLGLFSAKKAPHSSLSQNFISWGRDWNSNGMRGGEKAISILRKFRWQRNQYGM